MEKKLLMAILFCFGIAGIASAVEVINIDLNVDGDANAWTGYAAYDGGTDVWQAYYGGEGKAMGSQRSASLANSDEPCKPSTYAAQIWISNGDGDSGNHETYRDVNISNLLMCDGFKKKAGATADPNICLFGWDAYVGNFDIYVYGVEAGDFNLARYEPNIVWGPTNYYSDPNVFWPRDSNDANEFTGDANIHPADPNTYKIINESKWTYTTKPVSGGFSGDFIENQNYVEFPGVDVNTYRATITASDANTDTNTVILSVNKIYIIYTKRINGIQLVSTKRPVAVYNTKQIGARLYDVAYETNLRDGEGQLFGPDIDGPSEAYPYGRVMYLDGGEYMEYDITMNESNEGEYSISAFVDVSMYDACNMNVYVNGMLLGELHAEYAGDGWTNNLSVNIFSSPQPQTFRWQMTTAYWHNIMYFLFGYIGPINIPDCNAVYKYGFNDLYGAADLNRDCHVDYKDLKIMASRWVECYDPDPNVCPH